MQSVGKTAFPAIWISTKNGVFLNHSKRTIYANREQWSTNTGARNSYFLRIISYSPGSLPEDFTACRKRPSGAAVRPAEFNLDQGSYLFVKHLIQTGYRKKREIENTPCGGGVYCLDLSLQVNSPLHIGRQVGEGRRHLLSFNVLQAIPWSAKK